MDAALQDAIHRFIKTYQPKYKDDEKFIGCFKAIIKEGKVIVTQVELMSNKST
jgi:hypothetical protein